MGSFAAGAGTQFVVTSTYSGPFTISAGTTITNTPALNVTQTWNNAAVTFTGWQFNVTDTASNANSLLMDLQVGGSSVFNVSKSGVIGTATNSNLTLRAGGSGSGGSLTLIAGSGFANIVAQGGSGNFIVTGTDGVRRAAIGASGFQLVSVAGVTWSSNSAGPADANLDTGLRRTAAGVVSASDGSTGVGYLRTPATTVASLLSAATAGAGARAFVTDATVTIFASTVVGGGANAVPVVSNGTNWIIG